MSIPDEVKMRIRSVLLLSPGGTDLREFLNTYSELSDGGLNVHEYGFRNPIDLLRSIPDTVTVRGDRLFGIDAGTSRITSDIARQIKPKKKKSKVLSRSNVSYGRSYSFTPYSPNHYATPYHPNSGRAPSYSYHPAPEQMVRRPTPLFDPGMSINFKAPHPQSTRPPRPSRGREHSYFTRSYISGGRSKKSSDHVAGSVWGLIPPPASSSSHVISSSSSIKPLFSISTTSASAPPRPAPSLWAQGRTSQPLFSSSGEAIRSYQESQTTAVVTPSSTLVSNAPASQSAIRPSIMNHPVFRAPQTTTTSVMNIRPPLPSAPRLAAVSSTNSRMRFTFPISPPQGVSSQSNGLHPDKKFDQNTIVNNLSSSTYIQPSTIRSDTSSVKSSDISSICLQPSSNVLDKHAASKPEATSPTLPPTSSKPQQRLSLEEWVKSTKTKLFQQQAGIESTADAAEKSSGPPMTFPLPSPAHPRTDNVEKPSKEAKGSNIYTSTSMKKSQPVSSTVHSSLTYLKCYHLSFNYERLNIKGVIVNIIEKYIVVENTSPSLSMQFNELRQQLDCIPPASVKISEDHWNSGNLVIARYHSQWQRGVLLDSYVDPALATLPDSLLCDEDDFDEDNSHFSIREDSQLSSEKRTCSVYLFDVGVVVRLTSDHVVILTAAEYFWLTQIPPKCLLIALNNVVCLDPPYTLPLEPMASALSIHLSQYIKQEVECTLLFCYEDPVLPHLYCANSFKLLHEGLNLCKEFPQGKGLLVLDNKLEPLWQYEPHWAVSSHKLSVRVCEPLEWWPKDSPPYEVENSSKECDKIQLVDFTGDHASTIVMVMVQINTVELSHRLSQFEDLFSRDACSPSSIIPGRIYLMFTGINWLRVRILEMLSHPGEYRAKLLDFPRNRYQNVSREDLFEYRVDPEVASTRIRGYSVCPPFLCRALPVILPHGKSPSEYLEQFIGLPSLTANRVGLGYLLNG